jgi:hypothetical protein
MDGKQLANVFKRNLWVIKRQVDSLTHEDTLIQLPFRGNCLNFVLGHMAASRILLFQDIEIDQDFIIQAEIDRYVMEADPITSDGDDVLKLEYIMDIFEKSQEIIDSKISELTPEEFAVVINKRDWESTVGERIEFLGWHEAYHTGQTEYLRQLAGTDDKVI